MKKLLGTLLIVGLLFGGSAARGQDKEKPAEPSKPPLPLKMHVVFTEFDGEKKVGAQPYTFLVNAGEQGRTQLRMGVRVPVYVGGKESQAQIQYMDVGTNLDCRAFSAESGQFRIEMTLTRSSVYSVSGAGEKSAEPGSDLHFSSQPLVRNFTTSFNLLLRDGQTTQSTMATDPATGRVLKVDVTLTVVK